VNLPVFLDLDLPWLKQAQIRTVLDIGANTGQFASAVHEVLPHARIYSFEPLDDCYKQLKNRLSNADGFKAFNVSLSSEDGSAKFYRNAYTQSSSLLPMTDLHRNAFAWTAQTAPVTVKMRRLDSFWDEIELQRQVLVKIDVQGSEDQVLLGAERVIGEAKYVIVETSFEPLYEGQASFERVYDIMIGYGFRYAGNMDQLASPIDGRILQADALFVRRGEDA
jgi:FkbM family methyltransferase